MEFVDVESKIRELENKSKRHVSLPTVRPGLKNVLKRLDFITKMYIAISVFTLIALAYFKPSFIKTKNIDITGKNPPTVDYKRLVAFWLIISTILNVALYAYNRP